MSITKTSLDSNNLLTKATSHSAATGGSVVNEVQRAYDAHGRLSTDYQSHAGAVNTGSTPAAAYAYVSNRLRRTSITYPNDRVVNISYGSANSADEHLNRPATQRVQGESNDFTLYTWAGAAWPVEVRYPASNLQLTLKRQSGDPVGDAGDIYAGYDRFGRTVDLRWRLFSTGAHRERVQYGFDRNSRRTWRRRVEVTGWDNAYHYDSLGQLQAEGLGDLNLNQTAIGGIPATLTWRDFDPTGNWRGILTHKSSAVWLQEDRVHDKGNRLMQVEQLAAGMEFQPPVEVDAAGRMTKVPLEPGTWAEESREVKWDAWNRVVEVSFAETTEGAYEYDALHRRIKRTAWSVTWHSYFNDSWKVIEERRASHPTVAAAHYLWGLRHRDDLARRDRATTAGGSMSQRHYVLMDYHSPVAITGTTGAVQERYQFGGFGERIILNASNTPIGASAYAWSFAFQGQFQDDESGWLNYGFRYYAPGLGRFLSKDPIMEAGGNNLYLMSGNAPVNAVDWLGLNGTDGPPDCCDPCKAAMDSGLNTSPKGHPTGGTVICCGGKKYSCSFTPSDGTPAGDCIDKCIKKHEDKHHEDTESCEGKGEEVPERALFKNVGVPSKHMENMAAGVEQQCLMDCKINCQSDPDCLKRISERIKQLRGYKGIR